MQWVNGAFAVDTDRNRIDFERVYAYLKTTYWAADRTYEEIRRAWEQSQLAFGVYASGLDGLQVGCARVVTDTRTFGWLADVFVDPDFRGQGLGKFLVQCVVDHPDCRDIRLFMLGTRDAHGLYERYGWEPPKYVERFMIRYGQPGS
ncbi:MAG: GNAT family N-acetyltransferase [Candidatus Hydrogenedentes bacterium]|nr:GNAT family N-acetyltransferase [Candidatus Hydrogenedentota bacterium]